MSATNELVFREAAEAEVDRVLALRNRIFSPIARAAWEREQTITAAVAVDDGEIVGAIPLARREIRTRPGVALATVFENAVGTAAERRGQGVGHGMIAAAREFMRGRVDALCLYRGDEASDGYRFYAKTGHADLAYAREFFLDRGPTGEDRGVEVLSGFEAVVGTEAYCLPLFAAAHAGHGGFRERAAGFYRRALDGLIYESRPHDFLLLRTREEGTGAYVIAGFRRGGADRDLAVLEMAGHGGGLERVLWSAAGLAAARGAGLKCVSCDEAPHAGLLAKMGFEARRRHFVFMGQLLDPAAAGRKAWRRGGRLSDVRVRAWTPGGEWVLHEPEGRVERELRLEMKAETLTRLLFARAKVSAAIEAGVMTLAGATPGDVEALDEALPRAPWCYHALDYI